MLGRIQIDNEILIKFQTDEFFKNEENCTKNWSFLNIFIWNWFYENNKINLFTMKIFFYKIQ